MPVTYADEVKRSQALLMTILMLLTLNEPMK